jgi:hypothetical protein
MINKNRIEIINAEAKPANRINLVASKKSKNISFMAFTTSSAPTGTQ